jgi:glycosyltransferase involved in cell wall biosynthesis
MRLAFVVPRYGEEVVGGAEHGARMLAEGLARRRGWDVQVLTTAARDSLSWADEYPPGESELNGVHVQRFASRSGRDPGFFRYADRVLTAPSAATMEEAERFIELQGPECPDLVDAVVSCGADLVAFYPYLYYPTVRGIRKVSERAVLHPAAHDEAALHLPVFGPTFEAAAGLVLHTWEERRLVQQLFRVAQRPQLVLGLGVERARGEGAGPPEVMGGRPYLCCIGRLDDLKGTSMLAEFFAAYKDRHPGPLALAMAGPVAVRPIEREGVVVTGPVEEQLKWDILRGALALVSPSPYESFSLVLLEAWSEGLPVIVNAGCRATREHCERSGGGLWFGSYAEFEAIVDRIVTDPALRAELGERGRRYVEENFRWGTVVGRYERFLQSLLERVGAPRGH